VNPLDHVVLDDRHVLVSGGVVDGLYAEGGQDLAHPVPVMGVAQQRHDLHRQLLMSGNSSSSPLHVVQRSSDISNSTRRLGLRRMICLHSSEPIEPPAR